MNLLVILSALLYAAAFIIPYQLLWCIIPAFIIIFFLGFTQKLSFTTGFVWGIIAYGLHMFPAFYCLYTTTGQTGLFVGWFFLTIYMALFSAAWFYAGTQLARFCYRVVVWVLVTWLYILIMDGYFLCIFDYWEGYCCLHPLVPVMVYPQLLYFLPILGMQGSTLLFLLVTALCALFFITRLFVCLIIVLLGLLMGGYILRVPTHVKPAWLCKIACARVPCMPLKKINSLERAQDIYLAVQEIMTRAPQIELVLMPESTLPCALNICSQTCACLVQTSNQVDLILGSHRAEPDGIYNCCYWLRGGQVHNYYNKQHGVLFAERMPRLFDYSPLRSLIVWQPDLFVQSTQERPVFTLFEHEFIPLVCSDLFFARANPAQSPTQILLCLINDAWFLGCSVPDLLFFSACLKARAWGQPLLYVSYTRAVLCMANGTLYEI